MPDSIETIQAEIDAAVLDSPEAVAAFKIEYLGRKQGRITHLFGQMKTLPPEERRSYGQRINALKKHAETRLQHAQTQLSGQKTAVRPAHDLTLPGRTLPLGSLHPITQTLEEIKRVFRHFGFDVAYGPEIEDDWHNFSALNFPPDHPARDMQDTFFLEAPSDEQDGVVLRTHTSPAQIRIMEKQAPPIRVIVPGRVYRNEAISYKSFCLFHQVEGLVVDEGITMADLKEVLHVFAQALFGEDVHMRFRPSFFPFTEPSAEVDIWWQNPDGSGKWLEILGCGMVDPNVLKNVNIDPERYTGYAFGMGIDRIAMLRHGIEDIRLLFENDVRFLEQFS